MQLIRHLVQLHWIAKAFESYLKNIMKVFVCLLKPYEFILVQFIRHFVGGTSNMHWILVWAFERYLMIRMKVHEGKKKLKVSLILTGFYLWHLKAT